VSKEIWKDVKGYEGIYQVSSKGRVMRVVGGQGVQAGHIMKATRQKSGYLYVGLRRDGKPQRVMRVHRLVLGAHVGPAPSPAHQGNHKNGDKDDNRVKNLEWVTASENVRHAFDVLGREPPVAPVLRGEANGNVRLARRQVCQIRKLYATGKHTQRELAELFGVSQTTIGEIVRRETWKHVS